MENRNPRIGIVVCHEMFKKIDDFQFKNRYPNRAQATLCLIKIGLDKVEKEKEVK